MSDEGDTPPPHRSDAGVDLFARWQRDLDRSIRELRNLVEQIDARLQDGRMALNKHEEQIGALAKDLAGTDIEALALRNRIEVLEKREDRRSEREISETSGIATRIKETAILAAVAGMVGGVGLFLWWLLVLYVKAGASP